MSGLVAPVLAIIALCVAAVGVIAVQPVFWTMPTQLLSGTALAAGIGFVNLFGAIGGFWRRSCVQAETLFASSAAGLLTRPASPLSGWSLSFIEPYPRGTPARQRTALNKGIAMNALLSNPFKRDYYAVRRKSACG